jgi:glycosyltransferase involved in cell wall biosynthesis
MKYNNTNKVLFISYLFPPVAGGGVQRSSKFVKYLPRFRWLPLVLTVKEPYDFYNDDQLLNDVKDNCKIYRTTSIEPMKWIRKFLKQKWQKEIQKDISKTKKRNSLKSDFLVKLKTYLFIPDNEILWLPFAVLRGWRIIKKEKPAIIYSTASPFTDHLIALILKKLTRLPWVADFRDYWVDRANFPANRFRFFVDRKLEYNVLKNADHIITVTSLMADRFKELYTADKYSTITNGFDEDDFAETEKLEPPEAEFRIIYTGIFNKEQNPQKFFAAIKNLIDNNKDFKNKTKLKLIGQLDNPGEFENLNFLRELKLDKYSEILPYQSHKHVIMEMCQSTVLLLLVGEYPHSEGVFTGKIFEYLRSKRPILAIVPTNGVAAEVIRNTNSGIIVSHADADEISKSILKLFNLFLKNELKTSFSIKNIDIYSRNNLTEQLSKIFNEILNKNLT